MGEITDWRTSTRTQGQGQCVEVGFGTGNVAVRDTKNRRAGHFSVPLGQWCRFLMGVKNGAFDG